MGRIDLDYFVNKEKEGVVFGKISKSKDFHDAYGEHFPYDKYVGQVVSKETVPNFKESTIEPLDIAFGYFHYGDQLTRVSFTKLAEMIDPNRFSADEASKPYCFNVSALYVTDVRSLDEPSTLDIFREYMGEAIYDNLRIAISHLETRGCKRGAEYLKGFLPPEYKGDWLVRWSRNGTTPEEERFKTIEEANNRYSDLKNQENPRIYQAELVFAKRDAPEIVTDSFRRFRICLFGKEWLF
jgi:hypothetical protein